MLSRFLTLLLMLCMIGLSSMGQDKTEDVVYLKDGSIIRGTIIEQVPQKTIKIRTRDGSVFVYEMSKIEKITKEQMRASSSPAKKATFDFSALFGGAIYDDFFFGTGVRMGATFGGGIYAGMVVVAHFAEDVSISYFGGELGYKTRLDELGINPYVSLGSVFGGGESAFYVAPGFALYFWPTPNIGIGPDIKYIFIPDLEDGAAGVYVALMYQF